MGEGGGKDSRLAVAFAIVIFLEERGMLFGGIEVGRYGKLTCAALARAFILNVSLTVVTRQVKNIIGNNDTLSATLTLTKEEVENIYNEIRVELFGPLRADVIFADLSRESDKNHATLANKGRDMARGIVTNKIVTLIAASNSNAKIGIRVSVSNLRQYSQGPADTPLPK